MSGEIQTRQGEVFEIELESNPTTGFRWELASSAYPLLSVIGEALEPNTSASGAPAIQKFQFHALSPGDAHLTLHYRRSWEQTPPREIRSYHVHIAKA